MREIFLTKLEVMRAESLNAVLKRFLRYLRTGFILLEEKELIDQIIYPVEILVCLEEKSAIKKAEELIQDWRYLGQRKRECPSSNANFFDLVKKEEIVNSFLESSNYLEKILKEWEQQKQKKGKSKTKWQKVYYKLADLTLEVLES